MCDAVRQAYVKNIVQAFVVPALAKYARAGHPTFQNGKGLMVKGWATRLAEDTVKAVVESAEGAHNAQISVAERALAKKLGHAASGGYTSAFQGVQKGSAAALVRDIMSNPARVARGAVTTDVYNAAGQGVRFENGTGRFITFLEASKATR